MERKYDSLGTRVIKMKDEVYAFMVWVGRRTPPDVARSFINLFYEYREEHPMIVPPKESDNEDNIIQYEKSGYRYFGCEKCGKVVHLDHLREHVCNSLPRSMICPYCGEDLVCSDTEEHGQRPYCQKCHKIIVGVKQ